MSKLINKLSGKKNDKSSSPNSPTSPVNNNDANRVTSSSSTGAPSSTAPGTTQASSGTAGSSVPPAATGGASSTGAPSSTTGTGATSGPTSTSAPSAATTGGTGAIPTGTTTGAHAPSSTGAGVPSSADRSTSAAPGATSTAPTTGATSTGATQAPGTTPSTTATQSAAAPAAASGATGAVGGAAAGAGVASAAHHHGTGAPGQAATAGNPTPRPAPKQANIAIVVWSLYGHVAKLAEEVAKGVQASGAKLTIYQFEETLSDEVIGKMYGNKAPIASLPVITPDALAQHDGFLLGFPTRYGRAPAQVSAFFDRCGGLWMSGGLIGKFGGLFTASASQHGGSESTALTTLPWLAHMGVTYVPLGVQCPELTDVEQVGGGSWWGASTIAAGDGHLQPTQNDLSIAQKQGFYFGKTVAQFVRGAETFQ